MTCSFIGTMKRFSLFTKQKAEKEIRVAQNAISNVLTKRSRNKRKPASLGRWSVCRDAAASAQRDQCSNRRLFDKYPHHLWNQITNTRTHWMIVYSSRFYCYTVFIDWRSLQNDSLVVVQFVKKRRKLPRYVYIYPDLKYEEKKNATIKCL